MILKALIVSLLAQLPVYVADRADDLADAKAAQMAETAEAITVAARGSVWRARMLVVMGRFESNFALHIARGECRADRRECDPHRVKLQDGTTAMVFRAHSSWQLHESACSSREAWLAAKTDVRVAAREAARAIDRARGMCRSVVKDGVSLERATFSALAGRGCMGSFRGIDQRVATFRSISGAQ
jgi:hypothetical protein